MANKPNVAVAQKTLDKLERLTSKLPTNEWATINSHLDAIRQILTNVANGVRE